MSVDTSPENVFRRIAEAGAEDRVVRHVKQPDGSFKTVRTIDAIADEASGADVDSDPTDPRTEV
jgi:hypothetical protein